MNSIRSLDDAVRQTPYPVYLLIDEYDNFANEVMMDMADGLKTYESLVYEKGPLKTLFKAVKSLSVGSSVARTFITGVSPVVLSDITSGYNIAENIYLNPQFNTLCGFTESEVRDALAKVVHAAHQEQTDHALDMMRTWYNGYRFAADAVERVYNPTLALYFMKAFQQTGASPRKILDANLSTDRGKLEYFTGAFHRASDASGYRQPPAGRCHSRYH